MSKPASKETREKLISNCEKLIQDAEHVLRVLNESYKVFGQSLQEYNDGIMNLHASFYELVLEFEIGRLFIFAEIASSLRSLTASQPVILKRYHILQMRARIQEGMKYFMGFRKDKKGVWQRIKPILEDYKKGKYLEQYSKSTIRFKEYSEKTGDVNKKSRDIVEHFDRPTIMYLNWMNSGDEEFCAQMSIAFMDQVQALDAVVHIVFAEMLADLGFVPTTEACENQEGFKFSVHQLIVQTFRKKLYPRLFKTLEEAPAELDSQNKMVTALQSEYLASMAARIDYVACSQILTSMSETMMFLSFVRTELACAIVTYIQSATDFEATLNLRRLQIIRTATLDKIYGYKEDAQHESHWHSITVVLSIIGKYKERRDQIESKLQQMKSEPNNDLDLRSLYVHYRDYKINNIRRLLDRVDSIDIMKELDSSLRLLLLINEIEEFCYDVIYDEKQKMQKRSEEADLKYQEAISYFKQILNEENVPESVKQSIASMVDTIEHIVSKVSDFFKS